MRYKILLITCLIVFWSTLKESLIRNGIIKTVGITSSGRVLSSAELNAYRRGFTSNMLRGISENSPITNANSNIIESTFINGQNTSRIDNPLIDISIAENSINVTNNNPQVLLIRNRITDSGVVSLIAFASAAIFFPSALIGANAIGISLLNAHF